MDIEKALHQYYKEGRYYFLTQVKNGSTTMSKDLLILDGVAILKSWVKTRMIGYEIKVSRGDFLSDKKRIYYQQYVNEFYFICPDGMIKKDELPDDVGLCYVLEDGSIKTIRKAKYKDNKPNLDMFTYIIFSKLEQKYMRPSYRYDIKNYVEDKISDKELSFKFKNKLLRTNRELLDTNRLLKDENERNSKIITAIQNKLNNLVNKGMIKKPSYNRGYISPEEYVGYIEQLEEKLNNTGGGLTGDQISYLKNYQAKLKAFGNDFNDLFDQIINNNTQFKSL